MFVCRHHCRCLSVGTKKKNHFPDPGELEKLSHLHVLLNAEYTLQVLKILLFELVSWACLSTTTRPRVNVQCEPMVSVFLGFTIPCAFVSVRGMHGMCCTEFQVVPCFSLHSAPFFVIGNIVLAM